jgi:hypothetical protein
MTGDDCQANGLCVRPAEKERLVRMTIKEDLERIVLWSGSRKEIWEEGRENYIVSGFQRE